MTGALARAMRDPAEREIRRRSPSNFAALAWWTSLIVAAGAQAWIASDALAAVGGPPIDPRRIDGSPFALLAVGAAGLTLAAFFLNPRQSGQRGRYPDAALVREDPLARGFHAWMLCGSAAFALGPATGLLVGGDAALYVGVAVGCVLPVVAAIAAYATAPLSAFARSTGAPRWDDLSAPAQARNGLPAIDGARFASLDRGGRSVAAWRDAMRSLVDGADYRRGGPSRDELVDALEDPRGTLERRIGAALALAEGSDTDTIIRARIAAESADPRAQELLAMALDGELSDDALQ